MIMCSKPANLLLMHGWLSLVMQLDLLAVACPNPSAGADSHVLFSEHEPELQGLPCLVSSAACFPWRLQTCHLYSFRQYCERTLLSGTSPVEAVCR